METVNVLLDTNIFLHYLSLEQIEWIDLFPDQKVVLFICPQVIRELNKRTILGLRNFVIAQPAHFTG
jgi:rRNA-processing protein FCF1